MNVMPVLRSRFGRIDAKCFHRIDQAEHTLDLWPTRQSQQAVAAGMNPRDRGIALARHRRPQDVDARQHRSEVIGGPTHKGEDVARRERKDAVVTVDDPFQDRVAEPDSILDPLLEKQ